MKLKLRFTLLLTAVVVFSMTLTYLSSPAHTARAAGASTLNIAFSQEPDHLVGYYSNMAFAQWAIFLLQANLWDYDDKLKPVPVLIKEIPSVENGDLSKDGKTLTIKLKPGLKWSDGKPLNAHDVAFTAQMVMDKANNFIQDALQQDQFTGVKEVDDTTVQITTKDPQFPDNIASVVGLFYPLPAHIYEPIYKDAKAAPAATAAAPVGTEAASAPAGLLQSADEIDNPTAFSGPYTLKEWKHGESLTFVPNPNYVNGVAKIQTLVIKIFPDPQSSYAALAAGQVDWIPNLQAADRKTIDSNFKDPKQVTYFSIYGSYVEAWWLNQFKDGTGPKAGNAALKDPIVRHALELGMNRKGLAKDVHSDLVNPIETYYGDSPFEDKSIKFVDYDPAKANKMLDDAGYKMGSDGVRAKGDVRLEFALASTTAAVRGKNMAYFQQDLLKIGVKVNIQAYNPTTYFGLYADNGIVASGQCDLCEYANGGAITNPVLGRIFACDQIVTDKNPGGQNQVGYCNADFDKAELKTEDVTDPKAALTAAYTMQKFLASDLPLIMLYSRPDIYAYLPAKFVKTPHIGAGLTNLFYDVQNWEVK